VKYLAVSALCFFLCLTSQEDLFPQSNDDWIEGDFWVELDPAVREPEAEYPLNKEEAAKRALEEAQFVFSGILFGFQFTYIPYDAAREVREVFNISPLFVIPWGDSNLGVRSMRLEDDFLVFRIRYTLEDFLRDRLRGWRSNVIPRAGGIGKGNLLLGYREKITAIQEGIKTALRSYAQGIVYNKPREITGEAALEKIPYIIIDSGEYSAKVEVRLRNLKIVPYSSY